METEEKMGREIKGDPDIEQDQAQEERARTAIITGASSGMGKWFAILAPRYFSDLEEVWLVARSRDKLQKLGDRIAVHYPDVKVRLLVTDLLEGDVELKFRRKVKERNPQVELLVNSAGIGMMGKVEQQQTQELLDMIDLNCRALTSITAETLPYIGEGGHIIQMASAAAFVPQPGFAVYAATKSYVDSFARALNRELKGRKICVTSVCPGCVNTPFFAVAQKYEKLSAFKKIFMSGDRDVVHLAYQDAIRKKDRSVYGIWMKAFHVLCKILPQEMIMFFVK